MSVKIRLLTRSYKPGILFFSIALANPRCFLWKRRGFLLGRIPAAAFFPFYSVGGLSHAVFFDFPNIIKINLTLFIQQRL